MKKSGIFIIILTAVLIEVSSVAQYWFARQGIRAEAQNRAETELRVKNLEIQKVLISVETACNNYAWHIEQELARPDSIYSVLRRLVAYNPTIVGAGMLFEANYYPDKGRWFEPYVADQGGGTLAASQIGGETHDYLNAEFYIEGMKAGRGYWSEPYYDNAGAKMMLCTYTLPIYDGHGKTVALLGADVSLDWLSDTINARHIYPSSFNVLISRSGRVMVCPDEKYVMNLTIQEVTTSTKDTTVDNINREMLAGQSGNALVTDTTGRRFNVFYGPVENGTGWSAAVVCDEEEIFDELRRTSLLLSLFMVFGLLLLTYIIYRSARSAIRLQVANAEKERIARELYIASEIQKSMLPKSFPPYPERDDVDIYASLTAAKEIGGDLYDFSIRDGKLFFCIGDVSGKGVPASLVMAVTRSLFRTMSAQEVLPEKIVTAMNNAMADMNASNMFVTLFVGVLDLADGVLHYCNAGHDAPLLIGRGVGHLPVETNIPLGLTSGWNYVGEETLIMSGTTIFLYTDGLTEAENADHKQFGKALLMRTARQMYLQAAKAGTDDYAPRPFIDTMIAAVHRFVGDAEQSDDLTMLAIRYFKPS